MFDYLSLPSPTVASVLAAGHPNVLGNYIINYISQDMLCPQTVFNDYTSPSLAFGMCQLGV